MIHVSPADRTGLRADRPDTFRFERTPFLQGQTIQLQPVDLQSFAQKDLPSFSWEGFGHAFALMDVDPGLVGDNVAEELMDAVMSFLNSGIASPLRLYRSAKGPPEAAAMSGTRFFNFDEMAATDRQGLIAAVLRLSLPTRLVALWDGINSWAEARRAASLEACDTSPEPFNPIEPEGG